MVYIIEKVHLSLIFSSGPNRNWTTCHTLPFGSPSNTWRWVWRMAEFKDCVIPKTFPCDIILYCLIHINFHNMLALFWIREDFTYYADVCFTEFGDRVSHWTTINEPNIMAIASYDTGIFPPQRCSYPGGVINCTAGNSSVEPYTAMHNILLAHASAAAVYKEKYLVSSLILTVLLIVELRCCAKTRGGHGPAGPSPALKLTRKSLTRARPGEGPRSALLHI